MVDISESFHNDFRISLYFEDLSIYASAHFFICRPLFGVSPFGIYFFCISLRHQMFYSDPNKH
jgi:hypothetical protein